MCTSPEKVSFSKFSLRNWRHFWHCIFLLIDLTGRWYLIVNVPRPKQLIPQKWIYFSGYMWLVLQSGFSLNTIALIRSYLFWMTHHVSKFNLGNPGLNNGPQTPEEMRGKGKPATGHTGASERLFGNYNAIISGINKGKVRRKRSWADKHWAARVSSPKEPIWIIPVCFDDHLFQLGLVFTKRVFSLRQVVSEEV